MGVVLLDRTGAQAGGVPPPPGGRDPAASTGPAPESAATAYYAAWLDALEALLAERGLLP